MTQMHPKSDKMSQGLSESVKLSERKCGLSKVMLQVRIEQTERGEQAGRRRHDDSFHAEFVGHLAREQRTVAAERE